MPFDKKVWLDHLQPLLQTPTPLRLISAFWNGDPPKDVLLFVSVPGYEQLLDAHASVLIADAGATNPPSGVATPVPLGVDPSLWPARLKALLELGFAFDYTREIQLVPLEGHMVPLFGGDGTPLFSDVGLVSARLFRTEPDGVHLILQLGCLYPSALDASHAIKAFFGLFDQGPIQVCAQHAAPFGGA